MLGSQIEIEWAAELAVRSAVAVADEQSCTSPAIAPCTCKGVRVLHTYQRTIKIKLSWLSTGICLLTRGLVYRTGGALARGDLMKKVATFFSTTFPGVIALLPFVALA